MTWNWERRGQTGVIIFARSYILYESGIRKIPDLYDLYDTREPGFNTPIDHYRFSFILPVSLMLTTQKTQRVSALADFNVAFDCLVVLIDLHRDAFSNSQPCGF